MFTAPKQTRVRLVPMPAVRPIDTNMLPNVKLPPPKHVPQIIKWMKKLAGK